MINDNYRGVESVYISRDEGLIYFLEKWNRCIFKLYRGIYLIVFNYI